MRYVGKSKSGGEVYHKAEFGDPYFEAVYRALMTYGKASAEARKLISKYSSKLVDWKHQGKEEHQAALDIINGR